MNKIYLFLLLTSALLFSQKGNINIDPTFANNGTAQIFSGSGSLHKNIDDSFFVMYQTGYFPLSYNIRKFNPQGQIDSSFGNSGEISTQNSVQESFKIDSNGYIYLFENVLNTQDWYLIRYTPTGIIDVNFGNQGKVLISSNLRYGKVEFYQNKIYVNLLDVNNKKTKIYRFDNAGTPDTSFGQDGNLTVDYALTYIKIVNNKILGVAPTVFNDFSLIVQYNLDGTKDTTFGNNGEFSIDNEFYLSSGNVLSIDPDGKINLFFSKSGNNGYDIKKLVRLKSNGSPDTSFNNNGSYIYTSPNVYYSNSFVTSNKEIYLVGMGNGAYVSRINSSGVDMTFNQNGAKREPSFNIFYYCFAQSNNRLICLGVVPGNDGNSKLSIVGYVGDNRLNVKDTTKSSFQLYPNPTTDFLMLTELNDSKFSVKITDASGRTVKNINNSKKIDVKNLLSGTYYIEVITSKNIIKKSFIKK